MVQPSEVAGPHRDNKSSVTMMRQSWVYEGAPEVWCEQVPIGLKCSYQHPFCWFKGYCQPSRLEGFVAMALPYLLLHQPVLHLAYNLVWEVALMTLTVRYMRKKHTNDRCEVTDDMSGSEVRGRDLRVTNDEVERE